jgi:Family of unknown function (DUF6460)
MSIPAEKPNVPEPDPLARFLGGPPLSVLFRLALISILVGVILEALGFDPYNIIDSIQQLLHRIWDMGFDAVRFLWRYLLLGAVVVVPVWLVMRLARAPRRR